MRESIKETWSGGVLLVIVNYSVFWKVSCFTFIVHKLCSYVS